MNNFKNDSLMRMPRQPALRSRGTLSFNDMIVTTLGAKAKDKKVSVAVLLPLESRQMETESSTPTTLRF